ncbi:MAG: hypothetical protein ABIO70_22120 [Pseudomonadota bacterium]
MIDKLGEDIEALSEASIEDGRSLVGFTELSIHEATRAQADNDLLEIGLRGVRGVVTRLQERHPGLAAIANDIATTLSGMGF